MKDSKEPDQAVGKGVILDTTVCVDTDMKKSSFQRVAVCCPRLWLEEPYQSLDPASICFERAHILVLLQ